MERCTTLLTFSLGGPLGLIGSPFRLSRRPLRLSLLLLRLLGSASRLSWPTTRSVQPMSVVLPPESFVLEDVVGPIDGLGPSRGHWVRVAVGVPVAYLSSPSSSYLVRHGLRRKAEQRVEVV